VNDDLEVICPYCGETQTLVIDPLTSGSLVQDCDVCCNPWLVNVTRDDDGDPIVTVDRAQ